MSVHTAFAKVVPQPAAGQLDLGFAAAGKASVYFANSTSSLANDVTLDHQRRLLVAAKVGTPQGERFGLARLNADGSADLTFGRQGSVVGSFADDSDASAGKVRVLDNGHLLLCGLHYQDAYRTLPALALFDQQGQPVADFGDNGRLLVRLPGELSLGRRDGWLPPGVPGAEACDVQVLPDGRLLLLANHHFELADHVGILICLRADGSLDPQFNGGGFVMVRHLLMNTWLSSLALHGDGHVLVAGSINMPQEGLLARYSLQGQLDDRFAENGFLCFKGQGHGAQVSQVVPLLDGRLQCFGSSRDPMHSLSLNVSADGRPDRHCHDGEAQLTCIGHSPSQWTAALCQPDGRVLAAGATIGGVEADFTLARFLPDGQFDPQFAEGNGWVRTRLGRSLDTATSLTLQPDGAVVVAGYSLDGSYRAVVVRYLA